MNKTSFSVKSALWLILLLLLPLQIIAAELGEAGKRLTALPGVSDVESLKSKHFQEKYVFFIKQQLDAKDSVKGNFEQRVILCHRGFSRPTVLVTEGYNANYGLREDYIEELSQIFNTNIVLVEYRYFDKSMPTPCNWDYLTVENSLYDLHNVNQTLHALYKGKWIATGISKGGQTTMFYRSYFPDDVDISVPYVAPLNRSVEDGRHEKFLQHKVSTKENRKKVLDFQFLLFKRKSTLLPMFEEYCHKQHYTFNAPIGEIFDFSVFEYAFAFWQWGYDMNEIPTIEATDKQERFVFFCKNVYAVDNFLFHTKVRLFSQSSGSTIYSNLDYSVFLVFEYTVSFFNLAQRKTMGDEWGSVNLSLFDKSEHFFAVASVHSTRLEC
jgi:hypothetical protein